MVNELKLTVVHFTHQNPMQITACAWIYRWTKKLWKIRIGPRGLRAVAGRGPLGRRGSWAVGHRPPGRWAVAGRGPVFSKIRSQNSKRKWTDRMNADVLACKIEAIALTKLESPPLNQNGKKKGYIKLMEELWNAKGYGGLGFSSQNLRDQAARLEK